MYLYMYVYIYIYASVHVCVYAYFSMLLLGQVKASGSIACCVSLPLHRRYEGFVPLIMVNAKCKPGHGGSTFLILELTEGLRQSLCCSAMSHPLNVAFTTRNPKWEHLCVNNYSKHTRCLQIVVLPCLVNAPLVSPPSHSVYRYHYSIACYSVLHCTMPSTTTLCYITRCHDTLCYAKLYDAT